MLDAEMSNIGLLGLGVMGRNLARNIHSRGFKVSVYNRTVQRTTDFVEEFGDETLVGFADLKEFVQSIERPRKIIIMVPSDAVDAVLDEELNGLLEEGDMIMDGGNSYYKETVAREVRLNAKGIGFLGCGISGGEEGALKGPSLMPGGSKMAYDAFAPILEKIAAKDFNGEACVAYMGKGGAGHYVKMVHNGIEYGDMQLLAEAYTLLRFVGGLDMADLAATFASYNQGRLASFLVEILVTIFNQKDEKTAGYLLDKILDSAGQKGTGRWTAMEALELGIPLGTVMEAVNARNLSAFKDLRSRLGKANLAKVSLPLAEVDQFKVGVEAALFGAKISAYAQGFMLLQAAEKEYGFGLNLAEISRIWQGGCIIRAELLQLFTILWQKDQTKHLFEFAEIQADLLPTLDLWQEALALGGKDRLPLAAMASSLNYVYGIFKETSSANLIQAMRDFFGAHTYKRTDLEGTFHTEWGA